MTDEQFDKYVDLYSLNHEIEAVCSDNFERIFEGASFGTPSFEDIFIAYKVCLDVLIDNLTENLYFFSSGCTFEAYDLTTEDGVPITEKSDRDDVFKALNKHFEDRKQKLEKIFLQYASKTTGKLDFSIKEFPKNTTEKEKDILNHLSCNFHIKRELSPNGLLPLFGKNGTKRLIKALYECAPDYKDFQAFNFINAYIETNLPAATLQNYCREVKKDMPIKNV
jgi:ferritin